MNETDLTKTIEFIETYFHITLSDNEIIAISNELKDYTYDEFIKYYKSILLETIDFFTVAKLHNIIKNNKKQKDYTWLYKNKNFMDIKK